MVLVDRSMTDWLIIPQMAARIRHTALALIGILPLAGVACNESQPLPDIVVATRDL